jgi:membrane protein DedA with SNARE-associated domain
MNEPRKSSMRITLKRIAVSAMVIGLVIGVLTGAIDPTALARALAGVVGGLGGWAYAAVGGMAFLETGAFVGLIVPGETVVVVGGVAASHGDVSLLVVGVVAWIGAAVGDATSFHLGRRYGPTVIAPVARRLRISDQRLSSLERSLARHGGKTVLVGRFMGFVRALAPFMAGASGMRYRDLAPWSLAGSGAWAFAFTLVGFQFAGAIESASRRTSLVLAAVAAIVAVLFMVRHRRRARIATESAVPVPTSS